MIDDLEIADVLNAHFCKIYTVDDSNAVLPDLELKTESTLDNIIVHEIDVCDAIHSFKQGKASGPDDINGTVLIRINATISRPLCILFNRYIIFSSIWKCSIMVPIVMKQDACETGNYRPISLTSHNGKRFEKTVFKHLYLYLIANNLIYPYQSGSLPDVISIT